MAPQDYNQNRLKPQAIAITERDEMLSGGESALILAALCTLVVSILAVSIL